MFELSPKKQAELVLPSGKGVSVGLIEASFSKWNGPSIEDTYGNKALIDFEGKPLFAELAILRHLEKQGWEGVWVDNFRKVFRIDLPENAEPVQLPTAAKGVLDSVVERNGGLRGCWDVFAWREDSILFVESKRLKKDVLRDSQLAWAEAVLSAGFSAFCLILVEWDFE